MTRLESPGGKEATPVTPTGIEGRRYPEYRDSGDGWLGSVPAHWVVDRLKYVVKVNTDKLADATDPDYEIRYVDIGNVTQTDGITSTEEYRFEDAPSRARRRVKDGDTIISTVRTYLKAVAYVEQPPENLIVSTGFAVLRPQGRVDPRYLYRFVQSEPFVNRVVAHSVGVSYPAVNPSDIGDFYVLLPPLDEQRTIAGFLDRGTAKIDALVAKKRRLVELLEEKRTALVSHAVTKGLDPNVPMKDSGIEWLGRIPGHWEVRPLRRFNCMVQTGPFGSQLHAGEYIAGGTPVINPVHLIHGRIVPNDETTVGAAVLARLPHQRLEMGDIVFSRRGELGRCALVGTRQCGWLCGTGCMIVRFRDPKWDTAYLSLYLSLSVLRQYFEMHSVGSIMDSLSSPTLLAMPLLVPPRKEQTEIAEYTAAHTSEVDVLIRRVFDAINKLNEYRTALISAAVTGKIDVRERMKPEG